jgi:hypothetical protein
MNDDNTDGTPSVAGPSRKRTAAVAALVGVAGLVGGGVAAGAISSASAGSGNADGYGYAGTRPGQPADQSKPMRSDESLLTGTTRTKVLAAVEAKYPNATIQRVETDSDGVYEAHIVNSGTPLIVQVGKDFAITGTQSGGGPGGGRGHAPGDGDGDGDG